MKNNLFLSLPLSYTENTIVINPNFPDSALNSPVQSEQPIIKTKFSSDNYEIKKYASENVKQIEIDVFMK